MTRPKRSVWDYEGEGIGVRGATSIDDAVDMVLASDTADDLELEDAAAFLADWSPRVWRVPTAYFTSAWGERPWPSMTPSSFDEPTGRGFVRIVWFSS